MKKNLQWRLVAIAVVVGLSIWGFSPPSKKVRLGLDLKGGVHLVLRVQTDDALRVETQGTIDQLRDQLQQAGVKFTNIALVSPAQFRVEAVAREQDPQFREIADTFQATFTRRSEAAGTYLFEIKGSEQARLRDESVTQARETIERRVNELGVAEPIVAETGAGGDQILVQLPGVTDVARAKEIIRSTALLELKLVEQGPAQSREALLQASNGAVPPGMEVVTGVSESFEPGAAPQTAYYLVRQAAAITGRDLRNARPTLDEHNLPAVGFSLNQEGAQKFRKITGENVGRRLAIILDNYVRSAPVIESRISDEGRISGSFTQQEAQDLSLVLRSGALPASLDYLEERTIGPSLGADSIRAGISAATGGLALVMLFMLFYYRLAGINAVLAMVINLMILLGLMAYLGATLTLPGIAGFILTIGMGVDSNVLIFERIKEELETGKGVRAGIGAGFDRVFLTILDTHIASLIAAAFLFQFGTGPIRGFATTLTIGLLSNVFTAVFVSRTLFMLVLSRRTGTEPAAISI
ncbi:MAG: protein translocase subunit SecD [Acidobacteria bacterium]|nr:protein translocase subunit SecD [Acidobacteriota bacterium]